MVERQLPRGPDAPTAQALRLHRRPPSNVVTPALRERERGGAVQLGGTPRQTGEDSGWGDWLVLGAVLGVLVWVLVLLPELVLLVLFGARRLDGG
jgi:hypothetical protein